MQGFLSLLQHSALAAFVDSSRFVSMAIQILHVLGFIFLLAFVVLFTLRVTNLALTAQPLAAFSRAILRPYNWSAALALVPGVLLFLPRATSYAANPALVWKLVLLVPALLLQYLLLSLALRSAGRAPVALRAAAVLSLLLWFTVGAAGRAIGFIA